MISIFSKITTFWDLVFIIFITWMNKTLYIAPFCQKKNEISLPWWANLQNIWKHSSVNLFHAINNMFFLFTSFKYTYYKSVFSKCFQLFLLVGLVYKVWWLKINFCTMGEVKGEKIFSLWICDTFYKLESLSKFWSKDHTWSFRSGISFSCNQLSDLKN